MAEITWIKLNVGMFDNKKIKQIRKMPGGNDMVLFWVMLLTLTGRSNSQGFILFTETMAYNPEMLANEFDMELNTVKMALEIFKKFKMIEVNQETILITGWTEYQNIDGMERVKQLGNARVKKHREKKKEVIQLAQDETCCNECNVTEALQESLRNGYPSIIEVDIDIDKDITTPTTEKSDIESVDNLDYVSFFNNNMGHLMTSYELETMQSFIQDGIDPGVIIIALQQAVESDARNMKYIKAILDRWLEHGIKTVDAVIADRRAWEDNKKTKESKPQYVKKSGTFNNYEQRTYDYDDLEKKLLGNQAESAEEEVIDNKKLMEELKNKAKNKEGVS